MGLLGDSFCLQPEDNFDTIRSGSADVPIEIRCQPCGIGYHSLWSLWTLSKEA